MRVPRKVCASLMVVVSCCLARVDAATVLDFNGAIPGTIQDANGLGTGFTDRLPGTGTIYGNDPNLDLLANPGSLTITSAVADALPPQNFFQMETLGLKLSGIGTEDFSISAQFRDIGALNGQLMLYVGTDANNFVRAGFHPYHQADTAALIYGAVSGVQYPYFVGQPTGVLPGDDAILTFRRTRGLWQLSWEKPHASQRGG
jgi:hypothetical protein